MHRIQFIYSGADSLHSGGGFCTAERVWIFGEENPYAFMLYITRADCPATLLGASFDADMPAEAKHVSSLKPQKFSANGPFSKLDFGAEKRERQIRKIFSKMSKFSNVEANFL